MPEIKLQLNDFDYIIIDDIYNGGVNFKMFSENMLDETRIYNNGVTQRMRISERELDNVIQTFQMIKALIGNRKDKMAKANEKPIVLTKDLIHSCKTPNGGFTTAQVEYLGFSIKEKWINKLKGLKISKFQLENFKNYGNVSAKELRILKQEGRFFNIHDEKLNKNKGLL